MPFIERYTAQRWGWEVFLFVLVAFMLSYSWMFSAISVPNERSRVYLAVAMYDDNTVQIDKQLKRWGRIFDLAERDGHYYSDKAPGSSILGAIVYGVVRQFTEPQEWTIAELINLMRSWLMIPLSLIGFLLLRRILENLGLDPPTVDITSLGWILGTAAFHYGAAYFGHQIVSVALIVSLYCVLRAEGAAADNSSPIGWMVAGGAAAGIAGLTEYQAAIPCILLTFFVASGDYYNRVNAFTAWVAGALPFALILFWYNDAAFGGPLELSYHHLANKNLQEIHGQGIAGVTLPTWEYFKGSMFSLHRGLFTTSPLFLMIIPGLIYMWRRAGIRLTLLVGLTFLYYVLFISSSNMWFAGWGFGPRLLVPAMGLWCIAVAYAVQEAISTPLLQGVAKGLAAIQIAYHQTVVVFFSEPPETAENPVMDFVLFMHAEGVVSPNLGQRLFGLDPKQSVYLVLVLAGVVIVALTFRGTKALTRLGRFTVVAGVVVSFVVAMTIVATVDASWDDKQQQKWKRLLNSWEARER